jgi:formylglycine-generating enzyme required for sulfatase activity
MAVQLLEVLGKRLPTEAEFVYAATNQGISKFPCDCEPASWSEAFDIRPVRTFETDCTVNPPGIYGLFSNVAEWTSTWESEGLTVPRHQLPEDSEKRRVIRGMPPSVFESLPLNAAEIAAGPLSRYSLKKSVHWRQNNPYPVGFRGARSLRAPFLDDRP